MLWRFFKNLAARKHNRALPFDEARDLFIQWVESGRPRFEQKQTFNWRGMGFRKVGVGNNARVYLSPCGGFALRVTKRRRHEKGYAAFLRLALRRQNNPYYPRIYAHLQHGDQQVVLMEALREWGYASEETYHQATLFRDMCDGSKRLSGTKTAPDRAQAVRDMRKLIADGYSDDLHMGNLMCRLSDIDEHPVLTDPVW